jgi:hypothetical protein
MVAIFKSGRSIERFSSPVQTARSGSVMSSCLKFRDMWRTESRKKHAGFERVADKRTSQVKIG